MFGIEVGDEFVDGAEVHLRIHVGEVVAHGDEQVVCLVVLLLVHDPVVEVLHLLVSVVSLQVHIVHEWVVVTPSVETKAIWSAVMVVQGVGKDLGAGSQGIVERTPNPLHSLLLQSLLLVLVVQSRKEPGIKAHLSEQSWLGIRMSERINVPSDSRGDSEFVQQELVSNEHVVDHVFVVGTGLVVHAPPTVDDLQAALFD